LERQLFNNILQWAGTACLLTMYIVMSFFKELHVLQLCAGLAGGCLYLTWSVRVHNRAQVLVNFAGVTVCVAGLLVDAGVF
jgi:hypothetical protein